VIWDEIGHWKIGGGKRFPQALKREHIMRLCGTTEVVPFPFVELQKELSRKGLVTW
jgi:hypothetical protein